MQTSDALGASSTHLGPHAVALIVLRNKHLGLSHGKIATRRRHDSADPYRICVSVAAAHYPNTAGDSSPDPAAGL